ncbi:MAG: MFS transporter [Pirellulales bacterium]|nr:MFS transporter [Pirellulales bacterium]
MHARWLFVCSCLALITSAFTFIIRGDVLQDLGNFFQFSQQQKGSIGDGAFLGMAVSMLGGAFICDYLGMKRILFLALFSHVASTLGVLAMAVGGEPYFSDPQTNLWVLYGLFFLQGCGNGFTEVAINPLVATLYPRDKTHFLNILHAWWPGGLILGGLLALYVGRGIDLGFFAVDGMNVDWQTKMCLILLPAALYGLMLIPSKFPQTEAVQSGVSLGQMFMEIFRPLFLIWAFCMLLTAATELGPQQWQESVMTSVTGGNVSGTLILVYTSTLMFILRHFAGPIAHRISPIGLLLVSSVLAGTGLYLLSFANSTATAFGYATLFGLGIAYFWPTMLGVTAERFPRGGALALALMGCVGNLSISQILPQMGRFVDHYAVAELDKSGGQATEFIKGTPPNRAVDTDKLMALEGQIMDQLVTIQKQQPDVAAQIVANPRVEKQLAHVAAEEKPDTGSLKVKALAQGALNLGEIDKLAPGNPQVAELDQQLKQRQPVRAAEAVGFSMAFRWVSALPLVLIVIFGAILLYDLSRGGYKAEVLTGTDEAH